MSSAFKNCTSLKEVSFKGNLEVIETGVFENCTSLERIKFPDNCKIINDYAFYNCSTIKNIKLPDSVEMIGANCFGGCTALENIELSCNLKNIGARAFCGCTELNNILFSDASIIDTIKEDTFYSCTKLKTIKIPDSVKLICDEAFKRCVSLEKLWFNEKNTQISSTAFSECNNLIINYNKNIFEIEGHKILKYKGSETSVYIPFGVRVIGKQAFENNNLDSLIMSSTVNIIEEKAFYNCIKLKSVRFPDRMKSIGDSAFKGCFSLDTINCSEIEEIAYDAFDNTALNLIDKLPLLNVEDEFEFGNFNGKPIKWEVLKRDRSSIYVASKEILCDRKFDSNSNEWKKSELREWLNKDFYKMAFSTDEKAMISTVNSDKVTLLSKDDAERLMTYDQRRSVSLWWLRSPRPYCGDDVWLIKSDGGFGKGSSRAGDSAGVRPALYLDFSNL